jgi:AraC-like DNA-binding protein
MFFNRYVPDPSLVKLIECYWVAEDDDPQPRIQKIIPDGFTEIIFHVGDPYRINLSGEWMLQSRSLFAAQITKHFLLENTGRSGMIGIKFKPTALSWLFNVSMHSFTDTVVDISTALGNRMDKVEANLRSASDIESRIAILNDYFSSLAEVIPSGQAKVDQAVEQTLAKYGAVTVGELAALLQISERQLERLFNKHVGMSPKRYARIIRFNKIFELIQQGDFAWVDMALEAGFADQSHFIRNFKAFTGEDPTAYGFNERTMANFFLKKAAH